MKVVIIDDEPLISDKLKKDHGNGIKSTLNYVYFLGFLSLGVTFVIATEESISPLDL